MLRLILAWVHLLALGIGLWAVLARGEALKQAAAELPGTGAMRRAFRADAHWGVAAGLWLASGLWRYLGSTEKSLAYYNSNHVFLAKMSLFVVVVVLEIWPMMTLIRWRAALGRGEGGHATAAVVDAATARKLARISYIQGALVTVIVLAAVAMARGYGARG